MLPASAALSYSNVVSRKRVQSVECQTDLSWVASDNPIQTVSLSGRPGSASAGTHAFPGSTGPASASARILRESAIDKMSKGSAEPFKTSATGSAPVNSAAGLAEPDTSAREGLADPLKIGRGSHFRAPKNPVKKTKSLWAKGGVVSRNDMKTPKCKKTSQKTKGWKGNRPGKGHNNPSHVQTRCDPPGDHELEVLASVTRLPRSR